jgi:hypothetical protein
MCHTGLHAIQIPERSDENFPEAALDPGAIQVHKESDEDDNLSPHKSSTFEQM